MVQERASSGRWTLAGVFLATLVLHAGTAWTRPVVPLNPDFAEYRAIAMELLEHGRFGLGDDWRTEPDLLSSPWNYLYGDGPTALRAPGFPAFLAGVYAVLGENQRLLQVILAVVNACTVLVVFVLAGLVFGRLTAWVAAVACALDPGMVYCLTVLGREPILALVLTLGLLLVVRLARDGDWLAGIMVGACFGLGGYFKETILVASGVLFAWLLWRCHRVGRPSLRVALVMIAAAALTVAPWLLRNSLIKGRPSGIEAMGVVGLYVGLDVGNNWLKARPQDLRAGLDPVGASSPAEAERRMLVLIKDYARERPLAVARRMLRNVALFWSPIPRLSWQAIGPIDLMGLLYYVPCFALAASCLWMERRRPEILAFALLLLAMSLLHSLVEAFPRYRAPLDPVLVVLASRTTARVFGRTGSP